MNEIEVNLLCKTCGRVTKHWVLDVGVVKALKCEVCGTQAATLDVHGHEFMVLI